MASPDGGQVAVRLDHPGGAGGGVCLLTRNLKIMHFIPRISYSSDMLGPQQQTEMDLNK